MVCQKCGAKLEDCKKFCGKCGFEIRTNTNLKTKKYNKIIIVMIFFFILVVLVITIENKSVLQKNNTNYSDVTKNDISSNSKKELSLDNVQMNTAFTSVKNMNESTKTVANCALSYLYSLYPNFQSTQLKITLKDGYGRFWVVVNYVKSSTSEQADIPGIMVWIKDINDESEMGVYYSGSVFAGSNGWGTPLTND